MMVPFWKENNTGLTKYFPLGEVGVELTENRARKGPTNAVGPSHEYGLAFIILGCLLYIPCAVTEWFMPNDEL